MSNLTAERTESPLAEALKGLTQGTQGLHVQLNNLSTQLDPLLRPHDPMPERPACPSVSVSSAVGIILEAGRELDAAIAHIRSITERLDV